MEETNTPTAPATIPVNTPIANGVPNAPGDFGEASQELQAVLQQDKLYHEEVCQESTKVLPRDTG